MLGLNMNNRIGLLAASAAVALMMASSAHALVIEDLFDSSITSNPDAALIESAIEKASTSISSVYGNGHKVKILFEYQPGSFLGQSQSTIYLLNTGTYNNQSVNDFLNYQSKGGFNVPLFEGLTQQVVLGNGNGADPNTNMIATAADLRAIGFKGIVGGFDTSGNFTGNGGVDAVITLSSTEPLNFTDVIPPFTGPGTTQYSAITTVEHEIDEVLGAGGAGSNLNFIYFLENGGTTGDPSLDAFLRTAVAPLDRFRYAAPGTPGFTTDGTATAYFSLDNGVTDLVDFNQNHNGDYGDWGPNTTACNPVGHGGPLGLIQDAFTCNNQPVVFFKDGLVEDTALQSIGWNHVLSVPEPGTWAMIILGLAAIGGSLRRKASAGAAA
jgi:hypothetical protein